MGKETLRRLVWKLKHFHAFGLYHEVKTRNMFCPYCNTFYKEES